MSDYSKIVMFGWQLVPAKNVFPNFLLVVTIAILFR